MIHDISFPVDSNLPICVFEVNHHQYPCSWGRAGLTSNKTEGDGATPMGQFNLRAIYYRADRVRVGLLKTTLPVHAITPQDGWCDDIHSTHYNKPIKLPFNGSHEKFWREDSLYDVLVVVGYNDQQIIGKGSAIFIHIARDHFEPTAGCIGLTKKDLLAILPYLSAKNMLAVTAQGVKIISKN